jgi:hypothetical protein
MMKFTMYDSEIAFIAGVNQWHVIYMVSLLLCPEHSSFITWRAFIYRDIP